MKLFGKTVFILMFGLIPASLLANDQSKPTDPYCDFPIEQLYEPAFEDDTPNDPLVDNEVNIIYLLDKDGKPYIISIRSEDEQVSRMVRTMIMNDTDVEAWPLQNEADKTLGVTFFYNNIR